MKRQTVTTPATQGFYDHLHFAPAVRVGDTIWLSGQTGYDPATRTAPEGIEAQTRLAFEGIKSVLDAAGATMADIVEIVTFHTDLPRDTPSFSKIKDEYLPDHYPSWTAVGVTALAMPAFLVEIRVVAVAGSGTTEPKGMP
jgi:enamine deaminase RidA (YjgF/YER057c/UK114 family)